MAVVCSGLIQADVSTFDNLYCQDQQQNRESCAAGQSAFGHREGQIAGLRFSEVNLIVPFSCWAL
jgi:hypothetical protein